MVARDAFRVAAFSRKFLKVAGSKKKVSDLQNLQRERLDQRP